MATVPPAATSDQPVPPTVFAVGVNHRTAPSAFRETLYLGEEAVPGILARLRQAGLTQALVLSTCDRTEIIGCDRDADAAIRNAAAELARLAHVTPDALAGYLLILQGEAAIEHLFAIAASLDSAVIGEPQVLGQVRQAYRQAGEAGMVAAEFDRLLQAALAAAKRVRHETDIGRRSISMAGIAVQVARDVHGALDRCVALIIGAGEMGELLADGLRQAGLGRLLVSDSLAVRAQATAKRLSAQVVPFEGLAAALADADIVLTALGRGSVVIDVPLVRATLRRRRQKPIFLIDAAVPGDIAPAVNAIDEAFVYDLDDLDRLARENRDQRQLEADKAWSILREAAATYVRDNAARDAASAVATLRAHFETMRSVLLAEQPGLGAEEATRLLINRLLHRPSVALRRSASDPARHQLMADAMAELFEQVEDAEDNARDGAAAAVADAASSEEKKT